MRQINVTKRVKVATGEALIVDLTNEETRWEPFETRNIDYPLVGLNEMLGEDLRGVATRNLKVIEKRYVMPLDKFIGLSSFADVIAEPYGECV